MKTTIKCALAGVGLGFLCAPFWILLPKDANWFELWIVPLGFWCSLYFWLHPDAVGSRAGGVKKQRLNLNGKTIDNRLDISRKQEEVLVECQTALENLYTNGMGAREIAVMLHNVGPAVPEQVNEFQPFGFAAVYFDDDLFASFIKGDSWAVKEATFPPK